jgi:hypothetical protein
MIRSIAAWLANHRYYHTPKSPFINLLNNMNRLVRSYRIMATIGPASGTLSTGACFLPYCDWWLPGAMFGAFAAIPFLKTSRNPPELLIRCSTISAIAFFAASIITAYAEPYIHYPVPENRIGPIAILATTAAGLTGAATVSVGLIVNLGRWPSWGVLAEMTAAGSFSGGIFGALLVMAYRALPTWPSCLAPTLMIAFIIWQVCTALPLGRLLATERDPGGSRPGLRSDERST